MLWMTVSAMVVVGWVALSLMSAERQVKASAIQLEHFRKKEEEARVAAKRAKAV